MRKFLAKRVERLADLKLEKLLKNPPKSSIAWYFKKKEIKTWYQIANLIWP